MFSDLTIFFNICLFACKGRIKKLEKACVDLAALRASVREVKVITHNFTERNEHTGGDVRVTRYDDSTHTT